jgi:putative sugar O-methyltransferase
VERETLRRPFRAVAAAKKSFTTRFRMWEFANHGRRRFRADTRYNLQNVTNGFASKINDTEDDTKLLERICAAYIRTSQHQHFSPGIYKEIDAWKQVRERSLGPVVQALLGRDTEALGRMYRNFFRDPCSSGLLAVPNGMSKVYFAKTIKDVYRHFYLSHVLYRFDYWKTITENRFTLRDLAGPGIGNPFGVVIDGTHISVGSEYAHYCSQRAVGVASSDRATVAEIRGGFGGMAYYLLRDHPSITYLDFDVPESIALSTYYLMKSFPDLNFLLYGEDELTQKTIAKANVVLMPLFELASMPSNGADVTFSSHGLSNMSSEMTSGYLETLDRMTRSCLLYFGNEKTSRIISDLISKEHGCFTLTDTRFSGWHSHKISGAGVGGAANLAASMMHEQCFIRHMTPLGEQALPSRVGKDEILPRER